MKIIDKQQIMNCINPDKVISLIEDGFRLYSQGVAIIPPFGSLHFDNPAGEAHIKYGYIKNRDFYVVKIASNFHANPQTDLAACQGLMLIFSQLTGKPEAILLDEGYLTEVRTAAAGAVAAKYLAPKKVHKIGIVGTGGQAYYQLLYLQQVTDCREVIIWGRSEQKLRSFISKPDLAGFSFTPTCDLSFLAQNSNLIVTTTPSRKPLIQARDIQSGTHITAVGADDLGKQELDPFLFQKADIVALDSKTQCLSFGDSKYAQELDLLDPEKVFELGEIVSKPECGRINERQITIADLTGVAIQDIQIATYIYEGSLCSHSN